MKKAWNIQDGWHTLENQIKEGLLYASFGQAPISDNDICNIAIRLILDTGLFANEYTEWTARTASNKTWLAMKTFWPPKIRLRRTTSITASRLGFGMSGTINGADPFAAAMRNFGMAHQYGSLP